MVRVLVPAPTLSYSGQAELDKFAEKCAKALLCQAPHKFIFPEGCTLQHWPVEEIKAANEEFLKSLRRGANLYSLFVRPAGACGAWSTKYIGQRKSAGLRERITQHLINKHPRTGSMLEKVKTAVAAGQEVGVSLITVQPESLRLFVEETIIKNHRNELPWNKHG